MIERISLTLTLLAAAGLSAEEPKAAPAAAPSQPEIVLKVRIHGLKSPVAEVNSEPDEKLLKKMVVEVNAIWAPAGIRFDLDKVVRDDARDDAAQKDYAKLCGERDVVPALGRLIARMMPDIPIEKGVVHIVFVKHFPANFGGKYDPELGLIVTPQVVRVRKPKMEKGEAFLERELRPKVMAHELGHALSLLHVEAQDNLMKGPLGPPGKGGPGQGGPGQGGDPSLATKLTSKQIADARKFAADGTLFRGRKPPVGKPDAK